MQALDLNLASNPFRNNTLLWTGYTTATVLLLLFSLWNVTTLVEHRGRLRELRDTVGTFESQRLDLATRGQRALDGIRRFDIEALEIQAAKANEVIEWKAFSWTRLFNALEQVQPGQVRMTGVRPIFSVAVGGAEEPGVEGLGIPVSLEGVAHDLAAFTALELAMQEHPSFGRVEPNRLIRTEAGEIAFEMHAWYQFGDEVPPLAEPAATEAGDDALASAAPTMPAASQELEPQVANDAAPHENGAAVPDVQEPWTAGEAPGTGEVESAPAPSPPPQPRRRPASKGQRGSGR